MIKTMGVFRLLKNLKSKRTFLIIFWIVSCFISTKANQAKALEEPSTDPFVATLTIQRTNCIQTDLKDTVSLEFGFDPNNIQLHPTPPEPPSPPRSSIRAFFDYDPNITGFSALDKDSNQPQFISDLNSLLDSYRGPWFEGWQKAIFPLPDPEPDQRWEATWGIKISYPDDDTNVASLKISWDPDKLISGRFLLEISGQKLEMNETSEIQLEDIKEGTQLKIICSVKLINILSIICLGEQYNTSDNNDNIDDTEIDTFLSLGGNAYLNIQSNPKISHIIDKTDDVRFICSKKYYEINGNGNNIVYSNGMPQKDILEESITEWVPDRLNDFQSKCAIIIIYLVDHGVSIIGEDDGKIYLDTNNPDPDKRSLKGSELKIWLETLKGKIPKQKTIITQENLQTQAPIYHEIFIIAEACHSQSFINPLKSVSHLLIASTGEDQNAIFIDQGRISFTWFFWNSLNKYKKIKTMFNKAEDDLFHYIGGPSVQKPFIWEDPNVSDENDENKVFYLEKILYGISDFPNIPTIKGKNLKNGVESTHEITEFFTSKLNFKVHHEDQGVDNAWAVIIPPCCSSDSCRFYTNPNKSICNGNQCTFSFESDYFLTPGTEAYVYIKGANTLPSVPYIHRPNLYPDKDDFEPDDNPDQASCCSEEFQVHSFHDPNDIDWFTFPAHPEIDYYEIRLIQPSSLITDLNISPFNLTMFTGGEMLYNVESLPRDTNQQDEDRISYYWNNNQKNFTMIDLKIEPAKKCYIAFPYKILIKPSVLLNCYTIYSAVNKSAKNKIKGGHLSIYLLDKHGEKVLDDKGNESLLGWIEPSIVDKYNKCQPEYFSFMISRDYYTSNSCFVLYLKDDSKNERIGEEICLDGKSYKWLDPDSYFSNEETPSRNCDSDCDGRTDLEEQQDGNEDTVPDHPEVILHAGLNVFRYPFLSYYFDPPHPIKEGVDLYTIFCDTSAISQNSALTNINKICIFPKEENSWHCYDMNIFDYNGNPPEIFLENKSASLIYLNPNQVNLDGNQEDYYIISLPYSKEDSGSCYPDDLDDPDIPDKTKISDTKITIYQGLNLVSFLGYKEISGSIIPVSNGYFHSFSVARSLKKASSGTDSMNFSSIMRYDNNQGKWQQSSLFFGRPSGELFSIQSQEGYLIYMNDPNEGSNGLGTTGGASKDPSIDWLPDQIWSDMHYLKKENK